MRKWFGFFLVVAGAFLSVSAFAASYSVQEYTWCNGPINPGDKCTNPYWWHMVRLGEAKSIQFDPNDPQLAFSIVDDLGNKWSIHLADCNDPATALNGCSHTVDASNPAQISVDYSEWRSGMNPEDFIIKFVGDKEIQIFGPPSGQTFYDLNVKKSE